MRRGVGTDYDGNPQRTRDGVVEHKHEGCMFWHPTGRDHTCGISEVSTLLMMDEAISELASAKSVLKSVGNESDHVYQARFEQFIMSIDGVIDALLEVGMEIYKKMDEKRNGDNGGKV